MPSTWPPITARIPTWKARLPTSRQAALEELGRAGRPRVTGRGGSARRDRRRRRRVQTYGSSTHRNVSIRLTRRPPPAREHRARGPRAPQAVLPPRAGAASRELYGTWVAGARRRARRARPRRGCFRSWSAARISSSDAAEGGEQLAPLVGTEGRELEHHREVVGQLASRRAGAPASAYRRLSRTSSRPRCLRSPWTWYVRWSPQRRSKSNVST